MWATANWATPSYRVDGGFTRQGGGNFWAKCLTSVYVSRSRGANVKHDRSPFLVRLLQVLFERGQIVRDEQQRMRQSLVLFRFLVVVEVLAHLVQAGHYLFRGHRRS